MSDGLDDWPDDDRDEADVVACPNCGAVVYEDVEQCPACGEWVTHSTHPLPGRAWWFVGFGLIGVVLTIAALVLAGF